MFKTAAFKSSLFFAAAALVATAAPAATVEGHSRTVSYADLDLTTAQGAATLDRRIARAARQVCGSVDIRDLKAVGLWNGCRTDAIASAKPQVALALAAAERGEPVELAQLSVVAGN